MHKQAHREYASTAKSFRTQMSAVLFGQASAHRSELLSAYRQQIHRQRARRYLQPRTPEMKWQRPRASVPNQLNAAKFRQLYPFPSQRFHALLNSLFKVLCNFPSRYLFAIGLVAVFSLR
jgi:hypothetical protein